MMYDRLLRLFDHAGMVAAIFRNYPGDRLIIMGLQGRVARLEARLDEYNVEVPGPWQETT